MRIWNRLHHPLTLNRLDYEVVDYWTTTTIRYEILWYLNRRAIYFDGCTYKGIHITVPYVLDNSSFRIFWSTRVFDATILENLLDFKLVYFEVLDYWDIQNNTVIDVI